MTIAKRMMGVAAGLHALLAGCGPTQTEAERRATAGEPGPSNAMAAPSPTDEGSAQDEADERQLAAADTEAALDTRAKAALEGVLNDPFSARYRRVSTGRDGSLCGQVNAKNRMGAYTGFQTFITFSSGNAVHFQTGAGDRTDPASDFGPQWQRGCASARERRDYAVNQATFEDDYEEVETPQDRASAALGRAERGEPTNASAVDKNYAD